MNFYVQVFLSLRHIQKIEAMTNEAYQIADNEPMTVCEPAVAYCTQATTADKWNPNFPVHCTQEEFWDHIHETENEEFTSWEEAKKEFAAWKKEYLANRLK